MTESRYALVIVPLEDGFSAQLAERGGRVLVVANGADIETATEALFDRYQSEFGRPSHGSRKTRYQ